jgi:hypothetical protein
MKNIFMLLFIILALLAWAFLALFWPRARRSLKREINWFSSIAK